tara:strand:- start:533 stop:829 length:297 start_codon:yes stop_codon:yes gene_type:complete
MGQVVYNKDLPIYKEVLPNRDLLVIYDKPRIEHKNGNITGLCLDLRYYYSRGNGFIERKMRTDKEVILLSKEWASTNIGRSTLEEAIRAADKAEKEYK